MRKVENFEWPLLVQCYGFHDHSCALRYHERNKIPGGFYPLVSKARTFVPRFAADTYSLNWLSARLQQGEPTETKEIIREAGAEFPMDVSPNNQAYHTGLLFEGSAKIQPHDWPDNSPVDCVTVWSWTTGRRFDDISRGNYGDRRIFSARLGMGLIYSEPQRPVARMLGRTFDLTVITFQTQDQQIRRLGMEPDELIVRVAMMYESVTLSDIERWHSVQRNLFDRARFGYNMFFPPKK